MIWCQVRRVSESGGPKGGIVIDEVCLNSTVVEEALRAARRVNDYSTAVRIFEGLSASYFVLIESVGAVY